MQSIGDVTAHARDEVVAFAGRGLQQMRRADVHRRCGGLEVQEQRVDPAERFHGDVAATVGVRGWYDAPAHAAKARARALRTGRAGDVQ
ncbi:MAG: hypothetical protein OHK0044_18530 [Burkholderiaceae bacterium]